MAASGARPDQRSPGGTVSADVEAGVVDVLDRSPTLMGESSRHLLHRMIERRIGGPLQVPDYPVRRQWFVGLVDACRAHPEGLAALAAAVADLEPASPAAVAVRRLSAEWKSSSAWSSGVEPDAAGPSLDTGAATGPVVGPREPERLGLSEVEVQELAQVFHRVTAARQVLAAAGLPPGRHPIWSGMSPLEFWGAVNHLLTAGILRDGRRRVLAVAAGLYPANPVFAAEPA